MELRDVLSDTQHVKIPADASVGQALIAMVENKTDYLLVDRKGPNDSYGIVTRWDLVEGAVGDGVDLASTPVLAYTRKPLVAMNNLDLDVKWVAKKMTNENVSKIAVFDKENFLGFISDVDILRAVSAKLKTKPKAKEVEK